MDGLCLAITAPAHHGKSPRKQRDRAEKEKDGCAVIYSSTPAVMRRTDDQNVSDREKNDEPPTDFGAGQAGELFEEGLLQIVNDDAALSLLQLRRRKAPLGEELLTSLPAHG